jgi:transcriptional regulator with XRE-family HTH domain
MNIPKMIKTHREMRNMSQEEYAKIFGVTATAISLWETGNREAPYKVLELVFSGLGEEPKELIVCPRCGGRGICEKFVGECEPTPPKENK